jgi:subtilisin family serine protease
LLATLGAQHIKDLWMINAVAVTLSANAVKPLAAHGTVARIELDSFVQGSRSQRTPLSRTPSEFDHAPTPEAPSQDGANGLTADPAIEPPWNMAAVQANALWALGYRGAGMVVASMDTGVDLSHPQLRRSWRGGTNSWFDPHGEQPTPYDALGHGTQAMGVMVGAAGTGVAPQARWIAARLFNGAGRASMSDIHLAFQWLLDPDGDPATLDAPDVVNASWALNGRSGGSCIMEFSEDIQTLRSAGIAVVFAAGNDGPMPATSNSPGNNPGVLSVGAVDIDWQLARQTSRGPSSCDGGVFPRLLAPGVNIRSTDLSHGGQASFTTVSGSSLAAPHASGVLALLAGAFPGASVAELEAALLGRSQPARLDALAAFNALRGSHQSAVSSAAPLLLTR